MKVGQYLLPSTIVSGTIGAGIAATDNDPMTTVGDYAFKGGLIGASLGAGSMMMTAQAKGWDYVLGSQVSGASKKVSKYTKKIEEAMTPQQRAILDSFPGK